MWFLFLVFFLFFFVVVVVVVVVVNESHMSNVEAKLRLHVNFSSASSVTLPLTGVGFPPQRRRQIIVRFAQVGFTEVGGAAFGSAIPAGRVTRFFPFRDSHRRRGRW